MRRPNLVWITLDSLRADHTTVGGYERNTTPTLQQIAEAPAGRAFDRCFSHGRYTLVSSASILTGTYPSHHRAGYEEQAIPESIKTVSERLQEISYRTALISDNLFVSGATGLDRGFDQSVCVVPRSLSSLPRTLLGSVGLTDTIRYLLGIRRHSVGMTPDLKRHSRTYLLDAICNTWLPNLAADGPFFLYIHNDDTHRPYYPPLTYRDCFTDDLSLSPAEAAAESLRIHESLDEIIAKGCQLSQTQREALVAMYDAQIRYVDGWLSSLLDTIRHTTDRETIIVVTADHGELFGEQGLLGHKFVLDDALVNVPLVTKGLDIDADRLVQHADIITTLLARVGADTAGLQGVDLRTESRDWAIAQDHTLTTSELERYAPDRDFSSFPTTERTVLHDSRFKLKRDEHSDELYKVPDETTDVSGQFPRVTQSLTEQLEAWLETEGKAAGGTASADFSAAMRERLADLGYVSDELPD